MKRPMIIAGLLAVALTWSPVTGTQAAPSSDPVAPSSAAQVAGQEAAQPGTEARLRPAETVTMAVVGRGGVPETGVGAVALNVTVTDTTAASFITAFPTGEPRPTASNLNFTGNQTVPNLVVVKVGSAGQVSFYNHVGTTNMIVDVLGWFPTGNGYSAVSPARLLETRSGLPTVDGESAAVGALGARTTLSFRVAGRGGVPASGAGSAILNITAVNPSAPSFLTLWPGDVPMPVSSTVNFPAGRTVPNLAVTKIGANGRVSLYNYSGSVDVAVDLQGWFPNSSGFVGVVPARLLDTRPGSPTIDGQFSGGGAVQTGTLNLQVTGRGGVPSSGVGAVALNVTVTQPSMSSFLTAWPAGEGKPGTSNLNYLADTTIANMVLTKVGANGRIALANYAGNAHVVVDVLGWFPTGQGFNGLVPQRLFDSRVQVPLTSLVPGVWQRVDPSSLHTEEPIYGQRNFGYQRLVNSPAAPNVLYLGTFLDGMWKSTDAGSSWYKVSLGAGGADLDAGRLWAIAVDPTNADIVYTTPGYGSRTQGLWKSTDGGVNWTQMLPQSVIRQTTQSIYSININPADRNHILLGSHQPWGYPNSAGVLESRDGGVTWKIIPPGSSSWGWGHNVLFIDTNTWIVATQEDGFWRTTNAGASWAKVSNELMMHGGCEMFRAPNGVLYMGASKSLLRSTNNGASWSRVGPVSNDGYYTIGNDGTNMWIQRSNTGNATTEPTTYYTSNVNDGVTWTPQPGGQTFGNGPVDVVFDSVNRVLVASHWLYGVWRLKL
jgi:hypothetical protein